MFRDKADQFSLLSYVLLVKRRILVEKSARL